MLFNSYEFIFGFLPAVLAGYFLLGRTKKSRWANVWLLAMSLLFYSYWNIKYLPLLLCSIIANYICSGYIMKYRQQEMVAACKFSFILGLVFNIGLLCFFKYMDFFIANINWVAGSEIGLLHIILPLGISFFSITQLVYLVDCYEGVTKSRDFLDYSLFVCFFPHLLAGPILYHKPMMKQFADESNRRVNWENISRGATLFVIGLGKKVIIADSFIVYVQTGFAHPQELTFLTGWLTTVCYCFQLYFDFSGYSDMAVGLARMMNIDIPINFNSPYRAKNLINYWSRWHMSLTNTITSYLYTPILRSFQKMSFAQAMFATFMAMFIAGIWHGAGWTFVVFGTMHAAGLVVNHIWKHFHLWMPTFLSRIITLSWVAVALVFFRAEDISSACGVLTAMAGTQGIAPPNMQISQTSFSIFWGDFPVIAFIIGAILICFAPNSNEIAKKLQPSHYWKAVMLATVFVLALLHLRTMTEFLYFQF